MNSTPVRKITNSGTKKNTGLIPSNKNERSISYESLLERDYIYLLEFDDDVNKYTEQPITIRYIRDKRSLKYTPDFLVVRKNKKQLVEVKHSSQLQKLLLDPKQAFKFNIASKYCLNNNIDEFVFITEKDINPDILKNIKYLFNYSRIKVPPAAKLEIRNQLILNKLISINELLLLLNNQETNQENYHRYILSMIYSKEINVNLRWPLNRQSYLWI